MKLTLLLCAAAVTLAVSLAHGAETKLEALFSSPETAWAGQHRGAVQPQFVTTEFGAGYEFPCDFSQADPAYPRCYWDASFEPEDLSGFMSFALRVMVPDPEAVQRLAIYFKSGAGWYLIRGPESFRTGWNDLIISRGAGVTIEGQPAGWEAIDGIRLNVFPASKAPVTLTLVDLRASTEKLAPPAPVLFEPPSADRDLPRTERRNAQGKLLETRMILDETGRYMTQPDELLDRITRAGFNAFMPCVWHGRGAWFRSDTTIVDPGFATHFEDGKDPFADFITKAHARGIEVHAWFCVSYRGKPDPHPEFATEGVPAGAYDLQDPAVREWLVNEIVACAKRYDVDGINLDYIRTKGVSRSQIAREAYQKRFGVSMDELANPSEEAKQRLLQFQEAAVTDLVRGVREGLRKIKPGLILSVCGHPLPKPQLQYEGRNEWVWLEQDLIDIAYCMDYDWKPNFSRFAEAASATGYPERVVPMLGNYDNDEDGRVVSRTAEQVARALDYSLRKFPANGVALYWYPSLDDAQITALRAGPFREDALPQWSIRR